jgi:hypothetical protein
VAAILDGNLHRRKRSLLRGDLIEEGGRDVVRVRVDDHGTHPLCVLLPDLDLVRRLSPLDMRPRSPIMGQR